MTGVNAYTVTYRPRGASSLLLPRMACMLVLQVQKPVTKKSLFLEVPSREGRRHSGPGLGFNVCLLFCRVALSY